MRVRLGHLVGHVVRLSEFSIGQGKKLFGAFTRDLSDGVQVASQGVGMGLSIPLVVGFMSGCISNGQADDGQDSSDLYLKQLASAARPDLLDQASLNDVFGRMTGVDALRLLDVLAAVRFPIQRFVDDSFCIESTVVSLRAVSKALSQFALDLRHAFAGHESLRYG